MDKIIFKEDDWEQMINWHDERVAFIKPDVCDGRTIWTIYGADGTKLAATDNRDFAFVMARQNDLDPKSVHQAKIKK